ncbi:CAP domain-containing protein [Actinomadura sp. 3N508]|uniref:CAP domain-containing protein n=1 Tax=Actinomadura sp. 3N508 TaxID=3375153 RepID=UPI0037AF44B2
MPARTREPPLSTPRRPGDPAGRRQPGYHGRPGAASPAAAPRRTNPYGDELVASGRPRRGAPRTGPPQGGKEGGRTPRRRKSATGIVVAVTASTVALGIGVAIDRLLLPELRSERTTASGPGERPPGIVEPGPQSDPSTGPQPEPGTAGGAKKPTSAPAPNAGVPTPPLKTMRAPGGTPNKPSEPGTPPEGSRTPGDGARAPGGSAGSADAEAAVVSLTNAERAKAGCRPLHVDQRLVTAARKHSADMAANRYFDHTSRNGDSPWQRMEDAGYPSPGAENIAKGYSTAAAVMKGWMDSPGHRANILNCDLRAIGVGKASGPGGPLWTQDFGWR